MVTRLFFLVLVILYVYAYLPVCDVFQLPQLQVSHNNFRTISEEANSYVLTPTLDTKRLYKKRPPIRLGADN